MPEPTHILVQADYGASPLWVSGSSGFVNAPLESFSLSSELVAQLSRWAQTFDELSEHGYTWSNEEARRTWVEEGVRLAESIRSEIGDGSVVEFRS